MSKTRTCCQDVSPGGCAGCDCPCHEDHPAEDRGGDFLKQVRFAQALNEELMNAPRVLADGRAIRLQLQVMGQMLLTISDSVESPAWRDGW